MVNSKRDFRLYSWQELLKIRDSLQTLCDTIVYKSREWDLFDNILAAVSEEIDHRYKNDKKEG